MLHDLPSSEKALNRPKRLGASLAMDRLGTGPSSLRAVGRFALDEPEIYRSFVAGIGASGEDVQLAPPSPRSRRRSACARWPKASTAARRGA